MQKNRKGAFWQDRFHATAMESNRYFGSKSFVENMKEAPWYRATGGKIICVNDTFELRQGQTSYGETSDLDSGNTFLWDQQPPPLIGQFLHEN